jgi:uncharacterized protein (TIGR02145 family)
MRNADGTLMASSAVNLTFMIHDGTATGNVVFQESHALTSNAQGLVSCVVGNGVVSQGNFANINWGNGAKFLHVMMGTTDLGTQQMLSVPYALYSASSDYAANGFSNVSSTGDTLYMSNGSFIIVPGISAANYPSAGLGCTNVQACNYDQSATQDDGTCLIPGGTCNDGNSSTTNDVINANCQCAGTSPNNSGTGAQLLPGNTTCATQNISVTGCNGQTSLTYDGRTYDLVEIGGQCWFADNLATTQLSNGDPLPNVVSSTIPNFTMYNTDFNVEELYGKLYNWYAVSDSRGLCPQNWHVPTDCEWMYLESILGLTIQEQQIQGNRGSYEGGMLKSTSYWNSPNTMANNITNFSALPGGSRGSGLGQSLGNSGYWWTSSEDISSDTGVIRTLQYNNPYIGRGTIFKSYNLSVRCVKN